MPTHRLLRTAGDLVAAGLLPAERLTSAEAVGDRYAIGITPEIAALIDPTDADDPIARQFIPDIRELTTAPEESADPIGDLTHSPVPGIVHRYPDRVLLKAIHVCPVYCRFCFRREMVGPAGLGTLSGTELDTALGYIAAHPEIWEVILTGGDPLMLSPRRLGEIADALSGMPHVKVMRLHTRVPVVDPGRVGPDLVAALQRSGKSVWLAVHANHPRELTTAAEAAIRRLGAADITLISQTVLLRGINDDVTTLATLMKRFVELGIRPYYLHHPDLAPGTAEFRLSIDEGLVLVEALRGHVSGLAQPTYVLDIPGGHGKAVLTSSALQRHDDHWLVRDFRGQQHRYPPTVEAG